MRNGLFNVGAEALEDYETGVPTTNEARADTLLITRSSPTLLTSSHTRSPTAFGPAEAPVGALGDNRERGGRRRARRRKLTARDGSRVRGRRARRWRRSSPNGGESR